MTESNAGFVYQDEDDTNALFQQFSHDPVNDYPLDFSASLMTPATTTPSGSYGAKSTDFESGSFPETLEGLHAAQPENVDLEYEFAASACEGHAVNSMNSMNTVNAMNSMNSMNTTINSTMNSHTMNSNPINSMNSTMNSTMNSNPMHAMDHAMHTIDGHSVDMRQLNHHTLNGSHHSSHNSHNSHNGQSQHMYTDSMHPRDMHCPGGEPFAPAAHGAKSASSAQLEQVKAENAGWAAPLDSEVSPGGDSRGDSRSDLNGDSNGDSRGAFDLEQLASFNESVATPYDSIEPSSPTARPPAQFGSSSPGSSATLAAYAAPASSSPRSLSRTSSTSSMAYPSQGATPISIHSSRSNSFAGVFKGGTPSYRSSRQGSIAGSIAGSMAGSVAGSAAYSLGNPEFAGFVGSSGSRESSLSRTNSVAHSMSANGSVGASVGGSGGSMSGSGGMSGSVGSVSSVSGMPAGKTSMRSPPAYGAAYAKRQGSRDGYALEKTSSGYSSGSSAATGTPQNTSSASNSSSSTPAAAPSSQPAPPSQPDTKCTNCSTTKTPSWRRNPEGEPSCNACGSFSKSHGATRPSRSKSDVIKKRNRNSTKSKRQLDPKTTNNQTNPSNHTANHPSNHITTNNASPGSATDALSSSSPSHSDLAAYASNRSSGYEQFAYAHSSQGSSPGVQSLDGAALGSSYRDVARQSTQVRSDSYHQRSRSLGARDPQSPGSASVSPAAATGSPAGLSPHEDRSPRMHSPQNNLANIMLGPRPVEATTATTKTTAGAEGEGKWDWSRIQ